MKSTRNLGNRKTSEETGTTLDVHWLLERAHLTQRVKTLVCYQETNFVESWPSFLSFCSLLFACSMDYSLQNVTLMLWWSKHSFILTFLNKFSWMRDWTHWMVGLKHFFCYVFLHEFVLVCMMGMCHETCIQRLTFNFLPVCSSLSKIGYT